MLLRPPARGIFPATLALLAALSGCSPPPESPNGAPLSNSPSSTSAESELAVAEASSTAAAANSPEVELPEVELAEADLEQLEQVIQSHAGKVVVVDVWSTSCAPCMREFPHLVELSRSHPERLICISLNVDYIGLKSKPPAAYADKVQQFLQQQRAVNITNLLSASTDEEVLRQFSIGAIPAILIYSPDGGLQYTLTDSNTGQDGLTYEGDVLPKVRELLPARS